MKSIMDMYQFDSYPIVPSPQVYQYRNKIEFSFGKYMVRSDESRTRKTQERKEKQRRENETHEQYLERREGMKKNAENRVQSAEENSFSIVEHRQM
jgi:hypothetical protein